MPLNIQQYYFTLKFRFQLQLHFRLFQLPSSVNLLWCQMCTFYYPFWKKRCTLLSEVTDAHIWQHIHPKDWTLCLSLNSFAQVVHLKARLQYNTALPSVWASSSITLSEVYTMRTSTTQTRNLTVLWWVLSDQVTLHNSNIFGINKT